MVLPLSFSFCYEMSMSQTGKASLFQNNEAKFKLSHDGHMTGSNVQTIFFFFNYIATQMLRSSVTRAQFRVASLTEQYNRKCPESKGVEKTWQRQQLVLLSHTTPASERIHFMPCLPQDSRNSSGLEDETWSESHCSE